MFNRGNGKNAIFLDDKDYRRFIEILAAYCAQKNCKIYHWALMSNHYHLLMELEEPKELSKIMAGIARSYVHYFHKKYSSAGHIFQDRFKSQAIEKETYLLACGRYIERNPVKAGIAVSAEEYPYSSARFYVHAERDDLTFKSPYFENFGKTDKNRRENYSKYLKDFNSEEEKMFENLECPRGSKEFLNKLIIEKGIFIGRTGRPRGK